MVKVFTMPDIGEGMAEGEISSWLIKEGDVVKDEQPIAEIQNDKILQEILSPFSGKITKILVEENTVAKVGDPLIEYTSDIDADIDMNTKKIKPNDQNVQTSKREDENISKNEPSHSEKDNMTSMKNVSNTRKYRCVPSVRRYAQGKKVDINNITPENNKFITKEDIDKYLNNAVQSTNFTKEDKKSDVSNQIMQENKISNETSEKRSSVAASSNELNNIKQVIGTSEKMDNTRIAISKAMVNSKHTIPHVTLFDEVDVKLLVNHRKFSKDLLAEKGIKLTYMPYIVKSLVGMLEKFPIFNAQIDLENKQINYNKGYNIGIATDVGKALYVPVIKDADKKSLVAIAKEITENTELAKNGKLISDKMQAGSITISNLGSLGGRFFTPIINYPEVAILGIGSIRKTPLIDKNDSIIIGNVMDLSLSFDHRLIDGALAQNALNELKRLLSNPDILLMEA